MLYNYNKFVAKLYHGAFKMNMTDQCFKFLLIFSMQNKGEKDVKE